MPKLAPLLLAVVGSCHRTPDPAIGAAAPTSSGAGSSTPTTSTEPAPSASEATGGAPALRLAELRTHAAWAKVRAAWHAVPTLSLGDLSALDPLIEAKKSENRQPLDELVAAGLVSREAADVLNQIYGERIYHRLRPMVATCYRPTILGGRTERTRDDLERRLRALGELERQGKLAPEVARKVEAAIEREMEVLLRAAELWDKRRSSGPADLEQRQQEEQQILALFVADPGDTVQIRENVAVRPGVAQAMALVEALCAD
jgi:hypothetical protein